MGSEGHIFDMIRRNKANREMINARRERVRRVQGKLHETPLSMDDVHDSQKDLKQMKKEIAEKERDDRSFYVRRIAVIGGGAILVMYFVILIFKDYIL